MRFGSARRVVAQGDWAIALDQILVHKDGLALHESAPQKSRHSSLRTGLILWHPVIGFHVASVHSMLELSLMPEFLLPIL